MPPPKSSPRSPTLPLPPPQPRGRELCGDRDRDREDPDRDRGRVLGECDGDDGRLTAIL